jgi:hypothetical protein
MARVDLMAVYQSKLVALQLSNRGELGAEAARVAKKLL